MANVVLGLQAGIAEGAEATFDGQPMQRGTHLRWSFASELGFPSGAFWLLRRIATEGERGVDPPGGIHNPDPGATGSTGTAGSGDGNCTCCCRRETKCCGACHCQCVACERCKQGSGLPPTGGLGWAVARECTWGDADPQGWQLWSQPFTLPVTRTNWPARYAGSLNPATHADSTLRLRDIAECERRLGLAGLSLVKGMSKGTQGKHFSDLRAECVRLVEGWPAQANYDVPLQASSDGVNAPQLSLRVVEEFQLVALNPYMARVLGLYFVDEQADPTVSYDYCIVGVWLSSPAAQRVYSPGAAPPRLLAQGSAQFDGLNISADHSKSRLYGDPNQGPLPIEVSGAFAAARSGGATHAVMLAAVFVDPSFPVPPLPSDPQVCDIAFARPAAQVDVMVSGTGSIVALSGGTAIGTQSFSTQALQMLSFQAADPLGSPVDELQFVSSGPFGSVIVVGDITAHVVPSDFIGMRHAIVHAPKVIAPPAQPSAPVAIFRQRSAQVVDPGPTIATGSAQVVDPGPTIATGSYFDVQWVATPLTSVDRTGNPLTDPIGLPPPTRPVGFIAQQAEGDLTSPTSLDRIIANTPAKRDCGCGTALQGAR